MYISMLILQFLLGSYTVIEDSEECGEREDENENLKDRPLVLCSTVSCHWRGVRKYSTLVRP